MNTVTQKPMTDVETDYDQRVYAYEISVSQRFLTRLGTMNGDDNPPFFIDDNIVENPNGLEKEIALRSNSGNSMGAQTEPCPACAPPLFQSDGCGSQANRRFFLRRRNSGLN